MPKSLNRPFQERDVIRVTQGKLKGKTGVIVRVQTDENAKVTLLSIVISKSGFDHGIWFTRNEVKRIGRVKDRK